MTRPRLRDAFLRFDRQPVVHFYTTSGEKFAQAQLSFQESGLSITEFRSADEPYREDEEGTSQELLRAAIDEIGRTVTPAATSIFFVEDTSLRIEALSSPDRDYPGLRVKQWFASTSFESLDAALRQRGNDRRATVKSDIALHVPQLLRPVYFHGEAAGAVAGEPPQFEQNSAHPWLSPHTFNGWFGPEGASRPLGAMSLDESWRYDFRSTALDGLISRLEEYAAALNFPSHAAPRRRQQRPAVGDLRLFEGEAPAFVVIGPTCAGKTTFGIQAAADGPAVDRTSIPHIEASDIVRTLDGGPHIGESALGFAQRVLGRFGADIAARRIVDEYYGDRLSEGFAITGFRTIQELLYVRQQFRQTRVLFIEAPLRVRYDRFRSRSRSDELLSLEEFRQRDNDQGEFGLLSVAAQLADLHLRNDQSMKIYRGQIEALLSGSPPAGNAGAHATTSKHRAERGQLFRCLRTLMYAGRPLATDEIEGATGIRHNNANKILKRYGSLAQRLETGTGRLRYSVTDNGRAYVAYVEAHLASDEW